MTADTVQWTFLTPSLPPALRETCDRMTAPASAVAVARMVTRQPAQACDPDADMVTAIGHALLEVLTGRRAVWQLARWIAPESLDQLAATIRVGRWTRARLRSVRTSRVGTDDLLGRLRFECDGHPMIGCLRIQLREGRWHCTQFVLLLPGSQVRTSTAN
ncbi:MAG: Rv3235 family protein [Propionibacteriaceae bacterium]|nr:Rv3235 family protein [Propionibacteriaceae bacterium]